MVDSSKIVIGLQAHGLLGAFGKTKMRMSIEVALFTMPMVTLCRDVAVTVCHCITGRGIVALIVHYTLAWIANSGVQR